MERALVGFPFTARARFYVGSTPSDPAPDSATVEVIRSDGTVLVAAGTAAINDTASGSGVFALNLTTTHLALLDVLEIRWTITSGGELAPQKTYVEVVGGFLCTLADLKVQNATLTDLELADLRTVSERRLEGACRQAFVPRFTVESRSPRSRIRLAWPHIRSLRWASVGSTVLTTGQVSALNVSATGLVMGLPGAPTTGFYRTKIGYEHGLDFPSNEIREAVLLVADEVQTDPDESRVIRREADNQSVSYASPSTTSFSNPTLRTIVRNHVAPMVA